MKIAVVGLGYWGPNLVRNFSLSDNVSQVICCDLDAQRMKQIVRKFPHVKAASSFDDILKSDCDAVVVATPISQHYPLGMKALKHGKHVLIEKPLAMNSKECEELVRTAEDNKLVLMVDHTFLYTGAVRKMKEIVSSGEVGDLYYFDSVRVNLGLFQHDVNVIWDLAVHDLSIMDYVLGQMPTAVSTTGLAHVPGKPENIAYMTMFFDTTLIAHIHVNWLAPVKVRRTLLGGSRRMVVFDDLEASEKVKIYDKGISVNPSPENVYQMQVGYRTGDMSAPRLDTTEALAIEAAHFIDCVANSHRPITDGEAGLRIVRLLEAATESMATRGRLVTLNTPVHL